MVLYKGQRLKVPADAGIWYTRWEEGPQAEMATVPVDVMNGPVSLTAKTIP
jgi:hypothetical protein